jgi:glycerol-3-phosphate acyltransferase PlsY
MPELLKLIFLPFFAYLLGSIPFGLVLTRLLAGVDLRRHGSGNIGATNVRRTAGTRLGVATLILDAAKGAVPVLMAGTLADPTTAMGAFFCGMVGFAAFAGHLFPVYLKFRTGGKGVATAIGIFLVLAPAAMGVALLVFVLMVCLFDRVSAASLSAAALLPLLAHLTGKPLALISWALTVAGFIFWAHRANIARLIAGREPRAGL